MHISSDTPLLDTLLESWDRNNQILVNLLASVPASALDARALDDSKPIGWMIAHGRRARREGERLAAEAQAQAQAQAARNAPEPAAR